MAHLQWILFSSINLFGFSLHSITLLHYSLLLRDLLQDSHPQFPPNEDYRRTHLLLIHRSLSWNTSNATNVSFGMDGAKSPHLFTRGCTPGEESNSWRHCGSEFFPGEGRATKNPKVSSFDCHSTSNYYELLLRVFASLITEGFTIEKGISKLC